MKVGLPQRGKRESEKSFFKGAWFMDGSGTGDIFCDSPTNVTGFPLVHEDTGRVGGLRLGRVGFRPIA